MAKQTETPAVKFLDASPPAFSAEDAVRLARELYGLEATAKPLYSDRDSVFKLSTESGAFTLKIVHADEDEATIDFQIQALNWIARENPTLPVPSVQRDRKGSQLAHVMSPAGRRHAVWMLNFLPGIPMMEAKREASALRQLGRLAGEVDLALAGYFHPAAGREMAWDVRHAPRLKRPLASLEDAKLRALAERVIDRFAGDCLPRLGGLRAQVLHNDLNFHNVLVDARNPERITGLIDFGDMVHGPLILEVAIAGSDAVLQTDRPVEAVAEMLAAYHAALPLSAADTAQLFDLIQVRQALSLAVLVARRTQPDNHSGYLESYAEPMTQAMLALEEIGREKATETFRRVVEPATISIPRIAASEVDADRERMLAWRRRVMGPQTYMFYDKPLHMVRGEGAWLTDITGRRYLDVYNNVPHVGHCHPHVVQAIARQASILNTNTRYLFDEVLAYAEKLSGLFPAGLTTCMFVNSGSEAVDLAWRLAKAYTGNTGALVMEYAYHGWTDAAEALSPEFREAKYHRDHVRMLVGPDDYRGSYRRGDNDVAARYAADADRAIGSLAERGHKPALFIADSGFLTNGVLDAPRGYLQGVYDRVRKAGGLCVADEVQPGFGRQGEAMWGFQLHGVVPDIVCMGKPIGNGHPLGAVVTRPEIVQTLVDQGFFSTFGGNNVACAAGMAVLEVIEREGMQENARKVGAHFKQGLRKLAERHSLIGDVRGSGLLIGCELVRDRKTLEPAAAETRRVVNRMRDLGVLTATEGPHGNVLKLRPPICFSVEQADIALDALDRALGEN